MSVQHEQEDFLALFHELEARCKAETSLNQEWEDARAHFMGQNRNDPHAEHRFREWFLLERVSQKIGTPPAVAWAPEAPEVDSIWHRVLDSFYGIFQGIGTDEQGYPLLEDLWSGRQIRLGGHRMNMDDSGVMVGRVALGGEEHHVPFTGTSFMIAPGLADALARDLSSIRAKQPRSRLSQEQCEALLQPYREEQQQASDTEDFHKQLHELLEGQKKWDIDQVFKLIETQGTQEALNQIAFDSDIDLEALRHCIHGLSSEPPTGDEASSTAKEDEDYLNPEEILEALEAFESSQQNGKNLAESFSLLEEQLGLDSGSSDPYQEILDDDVSSEPVGSEELPGSAMWMATYLWEMEQMGEHPVRETLEEITQFLEFLRKIFGRNFEAEEVQQHQLLAYFCQAKTPEELQIQLDQLAPFLNWLIEEQGAMLRLDEPAKELIQKVVQVNQHWTASDSASASLALVQRNRPLQVKADDGDDADVLGWPEDLDFRPGVADALRGQWRHGKFHISAWFPQALMPTTAPAAAE